MSTNDTYGDRPEYVLTDRDGDIKHTYFAAERVATASKSFDTGATINPQLNLNPVNTYAKITDPALVLPGLSSTDIEWDTANQHFVCKKAGIYRGDFFINWNQGAGAGADNIVYGVRLNNLPIIDYFGQLGIAATLYQASGFGFMPMSPGDTVDFHVKNTTDTNTVFIIAIQLAMTRIQ